MGREASLLRGRGVIPHETREALEPAVRHRLGGTWAFRAASERAAAARFSRLAKSLREVGATSVVVEMAERAADDEVRHAALCASLADAYEPGIPADAPHDHRAVGRTDLGARDRVLQEMVAFCCVGETSNAGLLTRALKVVREPTVRGVMSQILRDEVAHSRIGWAHLAAEHAAGRGGFLSARLVPMLQQAHVDELFALDGSVSVYHPSHGDLSPTEMQEVFLETLREVILPGLESFGLGVGPARDWASTLGYEACATRTPA